MVPIGRVSHEENSCDVRVVPAPAMIVVAVVGSGNYSPSNSSVERNVVGVFIADGSQVPPLSVAGGSPRPPVPPVVLADGSPRPPVPPTQYA
jgi:hypothetical protein